MVVMDLPMIGAKSCPPKSYSSYFITDFPVSNIRVSIFLWFCFSNLHSPKVGLFGDAQCHPLWWISDLHHLCQSTLPWAVRGDPISLESLNLLIARPWLYRNVNPGSCSDHGYQSIMGKRLEGKRQKKQALGGDEFEFSFIWNTV